MKRIACMLVVAMIATGSIGCGMLGGGGGGGAWKPTECMNNQFGGDLSGAKTGQWMAYVMEAAGTKTTMKVIVVGDGWVEWWMEGGMTYGHLFEIKDKKIVNAWAAAKGDKEWTKITVKEPPAPGAAGEKPEMKESSEKKKVTVGEFDCTRIDTTMKIHGKEYKSTAWFSAGAWKLYAGSDKGGLVATEAEGSKTWLDAKGEDGKATLPQPK